MRLFEFVQASNFMTNAGIWRQLWRSELDDREWVVTPQLLEPIITEWRCREARMDQVRSSKTLISCIDHHNHRFTRLSNVLRVGGCWTFSFRTEIVLTRIFGESFALCRVLQSIKDLSLGNAGPPRKISIFEYALKALSSHIIWGGGPLFPKRPPQIVGG